MKVYYIDLTNADSPEAFHEIMKASLPLPAYYGNNLDALHDALCELSTASELKLIFYNSAKAALFMPEYMERLSLLLSHVSAEHDTDIRLYP